MNEARLENARRTKYALMGSGFHGTNGIDAATSYKIYHTYVLPKLIYGLEVLPLKKKHVENLESFHRKSIRYLQSLPQRIATAAIYLLVGAIPIEAELHKRKLSLLYSMLASDNSKIKEIINRQISVNYDNENSFFCNIRDILRDQPFNLKGGGELWFFVSFRIFFSDNTRVRIFYFFCRAKREIFSGIQH